MSENCSHDCSSCSSNCAERQKTDFLEPPHELSHIKKLSALSAAKAVWENLWLLPFSRSSQTVPGIPRRYSTPILPGLYPKGIRHPSKSRGEQYGHHAGENKNRYFCHVRQPHTGKTKRILLYGAAPSLREPSNNFGPMLSGKRSTICLFDMPPGTGDVPLTVFQSIPLDGLIIVTRRSSYP